MMKKILTIVFLCLFATVAIPVSVQGQDADQVLDLGEILIVTPELSIEEQLKNLPGTTTVIQKVDFDEQFTTVPDLLEQTAGVEITEYGGLGSFSTVSVRGASANQALVLLDGIALNQAYGGAVNLGNVPLQNVERIEVYRGHAPAKFHTSAMGGIINIITREPKDNAQWSQKLQMGSFGTHVESMSFSSKAERWRHAASAIFQGGNGDFKYQDDNFTPYNTADDTHATRENNKHKALHLSWKAELDGGPSERLKFTTNYMNKNEGVPGLASNTSDTAHLRTQMFASDVRWQRDGWISKGVTFAAGLQYSLLRQSFYDPNNEIGTGFQNNANVSRRLGVSTELKGSPWANNAMTLVLQWSRENFSPYDYLYSPPLAPSSRRTTLSAAIEDKISIMNDRLLLIPTVRYESYDSDFTDDPFAATMNTFSVSENLTSGSLGARYRLNRAVTLRANGGNFHRLPDLYELFGDRGGVIGNEELKPEEGDNYDFGFSLDLMQVADLRGMLEMTYFYSDVQNLVAMVQTSNQTAIPINIGNAEIEGLETALQMDLGPRWSLGCNYTWQDAINTSNVLAWYNKKLPGRSENQFNLHVTNYFGGGHSWYYEWTRDDGNFRDRANLKPVPTRNIQNIGLTWRTTEVSATVEVKNFGDEQVSDIVGFPLPGRAFYFTIKKDY